MDKIDYENIMRYFPPVNNQIKDIYAEANSSYLIYNSLNPLKTITKDEMYSLDILMNLQTLRILLNSDINQDRFIYELNKLVKVWGPGGYYGGGILNSKLLDLINKVNMKIAKQQEIIEESKNIVADYQMNELTNKLSDVSLKNLIKINKGDISKQFDLSKLNLYGNINKNRKRKNYKKR